MHLTEDRMLLQCKPEFCATSLQTLQPMLSSDVVHTLLT